MCSEPRQFGSWTLVNSISSGGIEYQWKSFYIRHISSRRSSTWLSIGFGFITPAAVVPAEVAASAVAPATTAAAALAAHPTDIVWYMLGVAVPPSNQRMDNCVMECAPLHQFTPRNRPPLAPSDSQIDAANQCLQHAIALGFFFRDPAARAPSPIKPPPKAGTDINFDIQSVKKSIANGFYPPKSRLAAIRRKGDGKEAAEAVAAADALAASHRRRGRSAAAGKPAPRPPPPPASSSSPSRGTRKPRGKKPQRGTCRPSKPRRRKSEKQSDTTKKKRSKRRAPSPVASGVMLSLQNTVSGLAAQLGRIEQKIEAAVICNTCA
jgi:hypothetical protein